MTQLIDPYNRHLNYLRISVTDRCNLRCVYCMPPGGCVPKLPHREILRYEEILRIVRAGAGLGITKVRVTGGEPLVRKGIARFLQALSSIPGISDIALTTNAVMLRDRLDEIRSAGIRRLNISLDTLDPEKYARITGRDAFHPVWEGIQSALAAGFSPIKINAVAIQGVNDDELADLARLTLDLPLHVRFIEYMPMGEGPLEVAAPLLGEEIMERVGEVAPLIPVARGEQDGPAVRYRFKGAAGEGGLIRPMSHHFCGACNRLRLTASGHLRPCLLSDRQADVKGPLRAGCSDAELAGIFLNAIRFKPMAHGLHEKGVKGRMSAIGG